MSYVFLYDRVDTNNNAIACILEILMGLIIYIICRLHYKVESETVQYPIPKAIDLYKHIHS